MLNSIFYVKHLANPRNRCTFALEKNENRGVEQLVARQAHNLEVARSSRAPATKKRSQLASFFITPLALFLSGFHGYLAQHVIFQFNMAFAKASIAGISASFIAERMVTMGSIMLTFFICSIMVCMALPAVGAQVPFSRMPTVRF